MFICMVDNDIEGKKRVKVFEKQGIFVPAYLKNDYSGDCFLSKFKDINECLVADRTKTLEELKIIEVEARKYYGGM